MSSKRRSRSDGTLAHALLAGFFLGCSANGSPSATASDNDAGTPPPSAYAECDPAGSHDAASFTYTATCTSPASDAGPASCAQWAEGAEGDWTPFLEICGAQAGTITTTPCPSGPDAGLVGACALPATCTTQMTVFSYDAADAALARATCATSAGTFSP